MIYDVHIISSSIQTPIFGSLHYSATADMQSFTPTCHKLKLDSKNALRGAILTTMADLLISEASCSNIIIPP